MHIESLQENIEFPEKMWGRIRNAVKAGHRHVEIPASNMKKALSSIFLYQLAFIIPGILPLKAISRNAIRDIPNFLMNARDRPVF